MCVHANAMVVFVDTCIYRYRCRAICIGLKLQPESYGGHSIVHGETCIPFAAGWLPESQKKIIEEDQKLLEHCISFRKQYIVRFEN